MTLDKAYIHALHSTWPPSGLESPAVSVWPVIPGRLDTSQHAMPHPGQPRAPLLSPCVTTLTEVLRGQVNNYEEWEAVLFFF